LAPLPMLRIGAPAADTASLQVQNTLIANKKRRTRKKPGPAYFFLVAGA